MTRVLYVGGFGNGPETAAEVGCALELYYDEVDVMTFSQAMGAPRTVELAARSAQVVTHSAGRLALHEAGAKPDYIHAFNAPCPSTRAQLLGRTVQKSMRMMTSVRSKQQLTLAMQFTKNSAVELAKHPIANMQPFWSKAISEFHGAYTARLGVAAGIPETFVVTEHDMYFKHDEYERWLMTRNGVHVVELPGQHDQLPLYPYETVDLYFDQHAR